MEATRLIDPAFWSSEEAAFPGTDAPAWAPGAPGLVWFRTSGSTGSPRWIGHAREGLLLSAAMVNRHLGVSPDDVWGLALPLRHVGGFGVVARAFEAGAGLGVFDGAWDPAASVAWLERAGVHHLSLVPTQVHDLVAASLSAPAGLKTVVVGGGVLEEVDGRAARALGWPVLPSYGLTEAASQVATASPDLLGKPYVTSPLPVLPHWEVECGKGDRISIHGRSLHVMEAVEAGDGVEFHERGGVSYVTGDRGRMSEGGLEVFGRSDLLVKVLGELIDPVAIERRLGVREAVVVAVPDSRRQHRLVVVAEGSASAELKEAVERHNAGAHGPERVEGPLVVPEFPRGELGKLRRAELARQLG